MVMNLLYVGVQNVLKVFMEQRLPDTNIYFVFESPFNTTGLFLLLITLFFHASLGLQVVIEDYVHNEGLKIASIILIKLISSLLGVLSLLCVLKLYLS